MNMNQNIPDAFYRTSVKALVLDKDRKFLLVQEKTGEWELPGGGLDFGETPQEGLRREIFEEMDLQITCIAESPSYFFTWEEGGIWRSNIIYETKLENFNFTPSDECVDLRFFTKKEALNEELCQNIKKFLEVYNKNNH